MEAGMSSVDVSSETATGSPPVKPGEMRLEAIVLSVSDVDRAKQFYESLGWRLDADVATGDDFRIVQLTPPGLPGVDPIRHEPHLGRVLRGREPVPGRLRHRGCARRVDRPRRRGERDLS
jgi:catechol 2,3-dioxygenase-like lactoylglutathione lyase family enzyme